MSIKLIGIELEGGWDESPLNKELLKQDRSVKVRARYYVGEMASPPFNPIKDSWQSWIKDNYPNHMGSSCGMHVHISFDDINNYSDILQNSNLYEQYLLNILYKWGKAKKITNKSFWSRLNGYNEFCQKKPIPNSILEHGDQRRYKIVNFGAYRKFETFEIRVLPMFRSSKLAIEAILQIMSLTNKFITKKLTQDFSNFLVQASCNNEEEFFQQPKEVIV